MKCYICGDDYKQTDMAPINTGRVHYICWACYKRGHAQAAAVEIQSQDRIQKEQNKKR